MGYWRPKLPWYRRELGEPLSWLVGVLSVVVAWVGLGLANPATYMGVSSSYIAGIVVGMVVHEAMHRNVARKYGMASQYVTNPLGIIITLVSALLPVKLIAPGYTKVYIYGPVSRRGMLRSVAAGPASNMLMSLVALVVSAPLRGLSPLASGWLNGFAEINSYLALFNLLPIPPLDGSKVIRWDLVLWVTMIASSAVLFVVSLML